MVQENLGWLYQLCEIDASETRVQQGLDLLAIQTTDHRIDVDGHIFHVVTITNSSIVDLDFSKVEKKISLTMVGPNGALGSCNMHACISTMTKFFFRFEDSASYAVKCLVFK